MNLYINTDQQWSGTQADAKALGKKFKPVEVPVDKAGLIAFLNDLSFGEYPTEVSEVVKVDSKPDLMPLSQVVQGCKALDLSLLSTALGVLLNEVWSKQESSEIAKEDSTRAATAASVRVVSSRQQIVADVLNSQTGDVA